MKLIFLDIDGVLVTRRPGVFEDALLRNLQTLAQRTGCDIVLSSDWRRHPSARDEACSVFRSWGLKVIGCTPKMSPFVAQRPTEILQWKRDFCKRPGAEPITHWLAIDDRALLEERHGQHLRGHFLHTHPLRGLSEERVDEGIRILSVEAAQPLDMQEQAPNLELPGHGRRGLSVGAQPRGTAPVVTPATSMAQAAAAAGRVKAATSGPMTMTRQKAREAPGRTQEKLLPALCRSTGDAASIELAAGKSHASTRELPRGALQGKSCASKRL